MRSSRTCSLVYKAVNHKPQIPAHSSVGESVEADGVRGGVHVDSWSIRKHQIGRRFYIQGKSCSRKVKGPRCHRTGKLGKSKRCSLFTLLFNLHAQLMSRNVMLSPITCDLVRDIPVML